MEQPPTNQKPGLLDEATKPTGSILEQIIQQHEAKIKALPQPLQQGYKAIMAAALKLLYSDQTHQLELKGMEKIQGPQNVVAIVVPGVIKLIMTVYQESQRKMSIPMSIPAAVVLACYILGDVEKMKGIPITPEMAAQTIEQVTKSLYKTYGISPQQVQQVIQQGQAKQGQPAGPAPGAPPAGPTQPPAPMGA